MSFSGTEADTEIHEQIVKEALYDTVCDANLKIIAQGCVAQDKKGSEAASDSQRHFADGNIVKSLAYVDREKRKLLNYAQSADTDERARARVLHHFGLMIHPLQDFYSQSNYLELKVQENGGKDPYDIELADWTVIQAQAQRGSCNLSFKGVDKSTPSTEEGQKKIGDSTYFKVARGLAIRETQRQWNLLEAMLRNRIGSSRSAAVISALKKSTCSTKVANEVLNDEKPDLVPEI